MDGYFLYIASKLEGLRKGGPERGVFDILGEIKSLDLWRAVLAEGLATMIFVFVGTSATVLPLGEDLDAARILRIGITFGLLIAVLIQMFGHVSGAHMNPCVSIAMAVAMKISPVRALLYVIVQCGGGIIGSVILKSVTPDAVHDDLGANGVSPLLTAAEGFGCEFVYSFVLVFSIFGCTDDKRPFFGSPAMGVGLTVAVLHFAGIPYSGASMNPARSLGPAVIARAWAGHWVYWAGPIGGGSLAAIFYKYIFDPYRGGLSMDDAMNKMMGETDFIIIPKSYLRESDSGMTKIELKEWMKRQEALEMKSREFNDHSIKL